MDKDDQGTGRVSRRLVDVLLGLGFLGTLSGFLGTVLAYLWPMSSAGAASELLTGPEGPVAADQIGQDQGVVGRSLLGKVLVVRKGERFFGLVATCTHLGCTVAWNAQSQQVECPCHGARYDLDGRVLKGPARQPLRAVGVEPTAEGLRVRSLERV
jgi:cytochrome b6-f complex iron-sulfur subunit